MLNLSQAKCVIYVSTDAVPDCQENPAVQVQYFPTYAAVLTMQMPAGILLRKHRKLWTLQSFPVPLNAAVLIYVKSWNLPLEIQIKEKS